MTLPLSQTALTGHRVLDALRAHPHPFTSRDALAAGASYSQLRAWTTAGLLAHPVRGVYHSPELTDDLALRVAVLRQVVPDDCVVTDRTAGWLWGADMILAPNDHLHVPPVSVFAPPGRRLRNGLVTSGERRLLPPDVAEVGGVQVTSPLRTACDLGRLLFRDQALAALDSLARLGAFSLRDLTLAPLRYAGYRGVIQLRALVPLVDPGAESPTESILRLRWLDLGLPRPRCQIPVPSPRGGTWWLDMGLEVPRFAAEYDGDDYHGEDRSAYDDGRRGWLRSAEGWTIVVIRKHNMFGRDQDVDRLLRAGARQAGILK
jgi:hypothetical protein